MRLLARRAVRGERRASTTRTLFVLAALLLLATAAAVASAARPKPDADRDGVSDARERRAKCNPHRADTDRDRMSDGFEIRYRLNCRDRRDASDDPDADGLDNLKEFRRKSNPRKPPFNPVLGGWGSEQLPDTGVALRDRFHTGDPEAGPYNDGIQARFITRANQRWPAVAAGRFGDGPGLAMVGPKALRVWTKPSPAYSRTCVRNIKEVGFPPYAGPDPTGLTGLFQPCEGDSADDLPAAPWDDPRAAVAADLNGAGGDDLVVADGTTLRAAYDVGDRRNPRFSQLGTAGAGASGINAVATGGPDSEGRRRLYFAYESGTPGTVGARTSVGRIDLSRSGGEMRPGAGTEIAFPTTGPKKLCNGRLTVAEVDGKGDAHNPDVVYWGRDCSQARAEDSWWIRTALWNPATGGYDFSDREIDLTILDLEVADLDGDGDGDLAMTLDTEARVGYAVGERERGAWNLGSADVRIEVDGIVPNSPSARCSASRDTDCNRRLYDPADVEVANVVGPTPNSARDTLPDLVIGAYSVPSKEGVADHMTILPGSGGTGVSFGPARVVDTGLATPRLEWGPEGHRPSRSWPAEAGPLHVEAAPGDGQIFVHTQSPDAGEDQVEVFSAATPTRGRVHPVSIDTGGRDYATERVEVGEPVTFRFSPDPFGNTNLRRIEWTWGDGSEPDQIEFPEASGALSANTPTIQQVHRFLKPGTYDRGEDTGPGKVVANLTNIAGQRSTGPLLCAVSCGGDPLRILVTSRLAVGIYEPSGMELRKHVEVPEGEERSIAIEAKGTGGIPERYTYSWEIQHPDASEPERFEGAQPAPIRFRRGRTRIKVCVHDSVPGQEGHTARTACTERAVVAGPRLVLSLATETGQKPVKGALEMLVGGSEGGTGPFEYAFDLGGTPDDYETPWFGPSYPHTFTEEGAQRVGFRVTDGPVSATRVETFDVLPPLTPRISYTLSPGFPKKVTFDGNGSRGGIPPYGYEWTLNGREQPERGSKLVRTFEAGATPTVSLSISDRYRHGSEEPASIELTINDELRSTPTASFSPKNPLTTDRVTFTAAEPPAGEGDPPFRYEWAFDGQSFEKGERIQEAPPFRTPGLHTVRFRVRDEGGAATLGTVLVNVAEPLAVEALTVTPRVPVPGEPATVEARVRGGIGSRSFAWDFGSGDAFPEKTGAEPSVRHTFDEGKGGVAVRVRDEDGNVARAPATGVKPVSAAKPIVPALDVRPTVAETGDTLTLDASGSRGGSGRLRYAFDIDGDGRFEIPASTDPVYSSIRSAPSEALARVQVSDEAGQEVESAPRKLSITDRLTPVVDVAANVSTGVETVLDASGTTGGTSPLRFVWTVGGKQIDTGGDPRLRQTFNQAGSVEVTVNVTDALGRTRGSAPETIQVADRCLGAKSFGPAQIKPAAGVCLSVVGPRNSQRFEADGDVTVNGLPIDVQPGRGAVRIDPPSGSQPATLTTPSVATVRVAGDAVVRQALNWRLPSGTGKPGSSGSIGGLTLPVNGVRVLSLPLVGSVGWTLEVGEDGKPFTRFRARVAIPGFKVGKAGKRSPDLTADINLRQDDEGTHTDGVSVNAANAVLGKDLEVENLCLSYVAAGVQEADEMNPNGQTRCGPFKDFKGEPFLKGAGCDGDPNTARWDGNAEVKLPFESVEGFKASAGVEDGKFRYAAAEVGPLNPGLSLGGAARLKKIRAGICLGPPLTIKGGISIGAVPFVKEDGEQDDIVKADGDVTYTDSYTDAQGKSHPWKLRVDGGVDVYDFHAGDAYVGFDGDATIEAGLSVDWKFPSEDSNLASLEGRVDGWINLNTKRFNVEGSAEVCALRFACVSGEGLVSSRGAAGCIEILNLPNLGFYDPPGIRAGFGFSWSGSVSFMGQSCDIGGWREAAPASLRRASVGPHSFSVGQCGVEGTPPRYNDDCVRTVRLTGEAAGPPDVRVTAPDGTVVETGPMDPGKGNWGGSVLILKDAKAGQTVVQLVKPAQGKWTIERVGGAGFQKVEEAAAQPVDPIEASVSVKRGRHVLRYRNVPGNETAVEFGEVGAGDDAASEGDDVQGRIGDASDGRACGGSYRCLEFTPAYGPAGKRRVIATMTRDGVPTDTREVASYGAAAPRLPGKVRSIGIRRTRDSLRVGWKPVPGADHYEVYALERVKGRPGRSGADLEMSPCGQMVTIPRGSVAELSVSAVNSHGDRGPTTLRSLRAGRATLGTGGNPHDVVGRARGEKLIGTVDADLIEGAGGNDRINGRGGSDCMRGGDGNDRMKGSAGNDRLSGDRGNDTVDGGAGDDILEGGSGKNRLLGGDGDDRILVANGARDQVDCGAGEDSVRADRGDLVRGCEHVRHVRRR